MQIRQILAEQLNELRLAPPPVLADNNQQPVDKPLVNQQVAMNINRNNLIVDPFLGKDGEVNAQGWFDLLEHAIEREYSNVNDVTKYSIFTRHLRKEAQEWLGKQLCVLGRNPQWNTVRELFITNYGSTVLPPAVEAATLKFKLSEDIDKYFARKCSLMDKANLQLSDRVGFLTDGCESPLRDFLDLSAIETLPQWLSRAKVILANIQRNRLLQQNQTFNSPENRSQQNRPTFPQHNGQINRPGSFYQNIQLPNQQNRQQFRNQNFGGQTNQNQLYQHQPYQNQPYQNQHHQNQSYQNRQSQQNQPSMCRTCESAGKAANHHYVTARTRFRSKLVLPGLN